MTLGAQCTSAIAMHRDCVACLSAADCLEPGEEVLTLLAMLCGGQPLEQIYEDLCFRHRRDVDDAAKAVAAL
jgi:hypothetical protein